MRTSSYFGNCSHRPPPMSSPSYPAVASTTPTDSTPSLSLTITRWNRGQLDEQGGPGASCWGLVSIVDRKVGAINIEGEGVEGRLFANNFILNHVSLKCLLRSVPFVQIRNKSTYWLILYPPRVNFASLLQLWLCPGFLDHFLHRLRSKFCISQAIALHAAPHPRLESASWGRILRGFGRCSAE